MRSGKPARTSVEAISCTDPTNASLHRPAFRCAISARHSSDLESGRVRLFDDRFLDIAELVLAEEHLLANEKRRRAETSARHRVGGVVDQLLLDVVLLGAGNQAVDIDAGQDEGIPEDLEIVHLL